MPSKKSLPEFTVHTLVKNEDRWIWYSLLSVLDFAARVLIYDTGSTDRTLAIIKSINSPKITLRLMPCHSRRGLVKLRQQQIRETATDFFLLLDGDEIWPAANLIKLLTAAAEAPARIRAFFVNTRNLVGDIYHYLPDSYGHYRIQGKTGHLNTRFFRNLPGLTITGQYPLEAYTYAHRPIQEEAAYIRYVDTWYLHATHLSRSTQKAAAAAVIDRRHKQKFRFGLKMTKSQLPAVFWQPRPPLCPPPPTNRWLELGKTILGR